MTMRYILLSYGNQPDRDAGEAYRTNPPADSLGPANDLVEDLVASGEFVFAAGLADPTHTSTVEVRDGVPLVTDGPFDEARHQLASFGIIDVANHDRAMEVAARSAAIFGRVEVRPLDGDTDGDASA